MMIKILMLVLCLIYTYATIKTIIKIYKDMKREDEIIEQLIMKLVWSQHRQENIKALGQEPKYEKRVDRTSELDAGFRQHELVCPECSAKVTYYVGDNEDLWDVEELNCCPNCGSKMEVKE